MSAAVFDLYLEQGAQFVRTFHWEQLDDPDGEWEPISIEGRRADMQIRRRPGRNVYLTASSDESISDEHCFIEVEPDGRTGVVRVVLGASATRTVPRPGFYDIELVSEENPEDVIRLIEGEMGFSAEVTAIEELL